jgi:inner membrane protein
MDPFTQGIVGGLAAQSAARRVQLAKAAAIGAMGGMAPDLDIFIASSHDPLLYLEFHRHFTHSLVFIPIGGMLCGLFCYAVLGKWWGVTLRQCLLWSTLGFATHGLLDACTSYGTRLLWPFSQYRVAWDMVSVIDPLFTLPSAVLVYLALRRQQKRYVGAAMVWMAMYFSIALLQHQRVIAMGEELAQSRGHSVLQMSAKPSFGNIVVWKLITETADGFHVDAIRPGWQHGQVWSGDRINKLDVARDFSWLQPDSQQSRDIARFAQFSSGYLGVDPANPNRIADIRYSILPQDIEPLWGIELDASAGPDEHVDYYTQRSGSRAALPELWGMIRGEPSVPDLHVGLNPGR